MGCGSWSHTPVLQAMYGFHARGKLWVSSPQPQITSMSPDGFHLQGSLDFPKPKVHQFTVSTKTIATKWSFPLRGNGLDTLFENTPFFFYGDPTRNPSHFLGAHPETHLEPKPTDSDQRPNIAIALSSARSSASAEAARPMKQRPGGDFASAAT